MSKAPKNDKVKNSIEDRLEYELTVHISSAQAIVQSVVDIAYEFEDDYCRDSRYYVLEAALRQALRDLERADDAANRILDSRIRSNG